MNTSLEVVLLEVAETATAAQNLGLHDILHLLLLSETLGNEESLLAILSHIAQGDGNSIMMQKLTGLVFMKLQSTQRQILVQDQGAIRLLSHALKGKIAVQAKHSLSLSLI